jgi:ATP-dependent Lon protease
MSQSVLFSSPVTLPLLPLRDVVVFPHMVIPLFVGRPKSIKALETAMEAASTSCWWPRSRRPRMSRIFDDLYEIGAVASILQMLKLPDGTVKVLVEGNQRVQVQEFIDEESHFMARGEPLPETGNEDSEIEACAAPCWPSSTTTSSSTRRFRPRSWPRWPASMTPAAWPTPSPPTCPSSWTRSRPSWK